MDKWIELDGRQGTGGGQVLRTALAMSAVTGRPFRMWSIRSGREKPGLRWRHWVTVRAVADICRAKTWGVEPGSTMLTFEPGKPRGVQRLYSVGSEGSAVLAAQAMLPALLAAGESSDVSIYGGTHVPGAPTWEFFAESFLPQLRAMGARVLAECERVGFAPAGGGRIRLRTEPFRAGDWRGFALGEAGAVRRAKASAVVSGIPLDIAESEADILVKMFPNLPMERDVREVDAPGPGNAAWVTLEQERVTSVFSEIGALDLSRKVVANRVVHAVRKYLRAGVPVGPHLADQLVVPMAAFGGEGWFAKGKDTPHETTNWEVVRAFGAKVEVERPTDGTAVVRVKGVRG